MVPERKSGTLQGRLPKELKLAGIADVEAANRYLREVCLPAHNARLARPAEIGESAFVAADPGLPAEALCVEEGGACRATITVAGAGPRDAAAAEPAPPDPPHAVASSSRVAPPEPVMLLKVLAEVLHVPSHVVRPVRLGHPRDLVDRNPLLRRPPGPLVRKPGNPSSSHLAR